MYKILLVCFFVTLTFPVFADINKDDIRKSADYIIACQLPNGLIAMDRNKNIRAVPYFTNFSAIGLLRAYQATNDKRYLQSVLKYCNWYISNTNADNTIYDFTGTRTDPKPTGTYDSTDSYAATFIYLCYETYQLTKDKKWIKHIYPHINRCVEAIKLTWQTDGLTFATPKYPAKYLMDNIEVRAGLRCGLEIAKLLNDKSNITKLQVMLKQNASGLKSLWNSNENVFAYVMNQDNSVECSLKQWYPDGMANAMTAAYILSPKDKQAVSLIKAITTKFPDTNDYWLFAAAYKFGFKTQASKIKEKLKSNFTNSLDHAHYIRTLLPNYDNFIYTKDSITLPNK